MSSIEEIIDGIHIGENHNTGELTVEWAKEAPEYLTKIQGSSKELLLQELDKLVEEAVRGFKLEIENYYEKKKKEGAGVITKPQRQLLGETGSTRNARHSGFLSGLLACRDMAEQYLKYRKEKA